MSAIIMDKKMQQSIRNHIQAQRKKYNEELEQIFAYQLAERRKIYAAVTNEEITEQAKERLLCKLEFETYKKLRKLENKYYNFNLYGSN